MGLIVSSFLLLLLIATFIFFHNLIIRRNQVQPPGPPGLPFIGNLLQLDTTKIHIFLWRFAKKYGPIMSMKWGSVQILVISSHTAAKEVFRTQDLNFCNRPKLVALQKMAYNGSDLVFIEYGESWKELRNIFVLHLLSSKKVESFRAIREHEVFEMINDISYLAKRDEVVNLSTMMISLASTIICKKAFGRHGQDEKMRFDELMFESQAMLGGLFVSDYLPLLSWVDKISGMMGRLDKVHKNLDEFYEKMIDEHLDQKGNKSHNQGILDLLIELKEDKSSSIDITWDNIKGILTDIFIAGTDTTAATIVWAMTALMQNPISMNKLQKEIRHKVHGKGKVTEDDIKDLPFLKAVIKETLRLYPPAPLLVPRETNKKCNILGHEIQSGTHVYINAWAIARDPDYWVNSEEFLPERFINNEVDILGQHFEVIPFGSGRRRCPGIMMGIAMIELCIANLVYAFDWDLPLGMKKEDIDEETLPGVTMHKKNHLRLVPRFTN